MSQSASMTMSAPLVIGADTDLPAAARATSEATFPVALVDLATRRIVAGSEPLARLVLTPLEQLVGSDATAYIVGGVNPALPLLVAGRIDGYETRRPLKLADGRIATVHVWLHALDDRRPPTHALLVVHGEGDASGDGWPLGLRHGLVLGTTDDDWRIVHISSEVESLLGYTREVVVGQPFLGAVHPGDVAEVLIGIGHAQSNGRSIAVRLRVRAQDRAWQWCRAVIAPLPGGTALAFVLGASADTDSGADLSAQLHERLARIAYDVKRASQLVDLAASPPPAGLPGVEKLTPREWEIVLALRSGARSNEIARSLHLAPSTVRNHLATIYRKLGVTSQVSLLAALSRADPVIAEATATGG